MYHHVVYQKYANGDACYFKRIKLIGVKQTELILMTPYEYHNNSKKRKSLNNWTTSERNREKSYWKS